MANFIKCNTAEGKQARVNLDHVSLVRPYDSDRGFGGSEIVFSSGNPSSIIVEEDLEQLVGPQNLQRGFDQV